MGLVFDQGVIVRQKFDKIRRRNALKDADIPHFFEVCAKHGIDPGVHQYVSPNTKNRPLGYSERVYARGLQYGSKEFKDYKVTF